MKVHRALLCVLILTVIGCVAKVEQQPQPVALADVDIPAMQERIKNILLWVKSPKITDVLIDAQTVRYAYTQLVGRPFVVGLMGGVQETTKNLNSTGFQGWLGCLPHPTVFSEA